MKRCHKCNYRARTFDRLKPITRQAPHVYECKDTRKCKATAIRKGRVTDNA